MKNVHVTWTQDDSALKTDHHLYNDEKLVLDYGSVLGRPLVTRVIYH